MKKWIQFSLFLIFMFTCSTVYWMKKKYSLPFYKYIYHQSPVEVVNIEPNLGIFFAETTEKLEPSTLAVCAIESASHNYPDRSVYLFMKGLTKDMTISNNPSYKGISLLSSLKNVHILPLNFEELFKDTPLLPWYQKINSDKEQFWTHVISDGFRIAVVWKYGGIYMDTDIISIKPLQEVDFLAFEELRTCSSSAFGFQRHHEYLWECMEDFVKNYRGAIWGQQGPLLHTRVIARRCEFPDFKYIKDGTCKNISILHPQRLSPIHYSNWGKYFEVWDHKNTFNNSYGFHMWNFMNKNKKKVMAGSNSLAENLFIKNCPLTYEFILKSTPGK
ncbi:alpha-1,4-N-acetylglucosaminyltransferase-like isoform X1 [Rhinatrema bivittatum]|uniref:alpha-1,4-N-acetylglucosaminyltransferase-like isoform X1 n=1 Tax=Rhinatrema bivittatum TaxID=194408 RepID=UPI001126C1D9|nr:alpha-1,4-N-acetylglucosaminyltransferase-like isoform X1 [Rhinatrema bivittatum]